MRPPALDEAVFVLSVRDLTWSYSYAIRVAERWRADILVAAQPEGREHLSKFEGLVRLGTTYLHDRVYPGEDWRAPSSAKIHLRFIGIPVAVPVCTDI